MTKTTHVLLAIETADDGGVDAGDVAACYALLGPGDPVVASATLLPELDVALEAWEATQPPAPPEERHAAARQADRARRDLNLEAIVNRLRLGREWRSR